MGWVVVPKRYVYIQNLWNFWMLLYMEKAMADVIKLRILRWDYKREEGELWQKRRGHRSTEEKVI